MLPRPNPPIAESLHQPPEQHSSLPPPRTTRVPPDAPAEINENDLDSTGGDRPLDASPQEVAAILCPDPSTTDDTGRSDTNAAKSADHSYPGRRLLGFFKGTTRAAVESAITADSLKAKTGSVPAKARLGVVPRPGPDRISGPVGFKSRYHGHRGHVYISAVPDESSASAIVSFARDSVLKRAGISGRDQQGEHAEWRLAVGDIAKLKKLGGYGWKTQLVVGWALEKEVTNGLEIVTRPGETWKITACPLRDELFNRLVAMGGQKWESW